MLDANVSKQIRFSQIQFSCCSYSSGASKYKKFCQFWEIDFRNKEPKRTERADIRGTLEMKVLNNFSKTVSNSPITSFCYVVILDIYYLLYMIDFV